MNADLREIADETIAYWSGRGIDFADAWWAMEQRSIPRGWGQVRGYMVRSMLIRLPPNGAKC